LDEKRLAAKDREKSNRTWPYVLISGAGIFILGVILVLILLEGDFSPFRGCDFDRNSWLEARGLALDAAYDKAKPQAEKLINCDDLLYQRSRAQVERLLGTRSFKVRRGWGYDIGVPDGLSDYPGLQVQFDRDGRVIDVSVPGYIERD
jgi:hypothetical protein